MTKGRVVVGKPVKAVAGPLSGELSETTYVLPDGLEYDQWAAEGLVLVAMAQSALWWLGDWIMYGEHCYGEKYAQAVEATGLANQTLRNAVWVASKIPPRDRRAKVPWSHHRAAASLKPNDRRALLKRAEDEHLSEYDVRMAAKELRGEGAGSNGSGKAEVVEHQGHKVMSLVEAVSEAIDALDDAEAKQNWGLVKTARAILADAREAEASR